MEIKFANKAGQAEVNPHKKSFFSMMEKTLSFHLNVLLSFLLRGSPKIA